jgi:hypothetical protein
MTPPFWLVSTGEAATNGYFGPSDSEASWISLGSILLVGRRGPRRSRAHMANSTVIA